MASESQLTTWVSDKLMALMGYSKAVVVQYVIRLSKESSSPGDLLGRLLEYGFSSSAETRSFAEEMYARVPRKLSGLSSYQREEKEAASLAKKQRNYKLLDADDDDDVVHEQLQTSSVSSQQGKTDGHRKRFRKKIEIQDSEDNEVITQKDNGRQVRRRTSTMDGNDDDIEGWRKK